ncbi:MAG: hypothetical protein ABEJ06_03615 [Haloarculaceae archaeon]
MGRWLRRSLALLAGGSLLVLAQALVRARDVPFSPLTAGRSVGPDYVERNDLALPGTAVGEVDDLDIYARADFDPAVLHPEVRRFYERTSEFEMTYEVTWHAGFRVGAALASRLTARLEQLNLPGPGEPGPRRLASQLVDVDPAADPREGARAWVRTDPDTGEAVFVAVYASHEADGERYTNIAVPLPGSNLSTVLRPSSFDGTGAGAGMELTTRAPGDPGLYLVVPPVGLQLPMDQRFRVWPADAPDAPADLTGGRATLVATHELWVFGRRFLSIRYAMA